MRLTLITDFQFWFIVILQLVGFVIVCFKLYAKAYSTEKGKNLATKEDIGGITRIVESIRTSLAKEIEELKSDLSYKSEHLIHLRAAERSAIINYYKATEVLVLNFKRPDLIKNEIDYFDVNEGTVSGLELRRYTSEAQLVLNRIQEDVSNLRYQCDISESELRFFYDDLELNSIINELNLSLSEFERNLIGSINLLLQVFAEAIAKINTGQHSPVEIIIEVQRKRSSILTKWDENRKNSLSFIRTFSQNLKDLLHDRLKSLTS